MSRISKSNANELAHTILLGNLQEVERLRKLQEEKAIDLVIYHTPNGVNDLYGGKYRKYIRTTTAFEFLPKQGEEEVTDTISVSVGVEMPNDYPSNYRGRCEVYPTQYEVLKRLTSAHNSAKEAYKSLLIEVDNAIYALKTKKNIVEAFPDFEKDIAKYFNSNSTMLPSNLLSIKNRIITK